MHLIIYPSNYIYVYFPDVNAAARREWRKRKEIMKSSCTEDALDNMYVIAHRKILYRVLALVLVQNPCSQHFV